MKTTDPKYLVDMKQPTKWSVPKGARVGIDLILRRLTDDQYSHVLSWPMLRANQFKHVGVNVETIHEAIGPEAEYNAWKDFDIVIIYHDMACFPTRNLVNVYDIGVDRSAWFFERLIWEKHKHIKFMSLDIPMIPYGRRCEYKSPRPGTSDTWKTVDWKGVQDLCDRTDEWVLDPGVQEGGVHTVKHLTIGDSHAHSAYKPPSLVLRKDARHLRGLLKKGIHKEIADAGFDIKQIESLTCYHGSIDIRHHLCREADPAAATDKLIADYEAELKRLDGRPIELVMPLPIEDESRKVPKMGWYKGTGFYGSQKERIEVRNRFEGRLKEAASRNNWTVFEWPREWYEMDGVEFMNTYMERPRSVHLAWKYYRWDLAKDEPNKLHSTSKAGSLLEF